MVKIVSCTDWTSKFFGNLDLLLVQLYPLLNFSEKMIKLTLLSKSTYKIVSVKKRDVQYYNLMSSDLIKYVAEITLY